MQPSNILLLFAFPDLLSFLFLFLPLPPVYNINVFPESPLIEHGTEHICAALFTWARFNIDQNKHLKTFTYTNVTKFTNIGWKIAVAWIKKNRIPYCGIRYLKGFEDTLQLRSYFKSYSFLFFKLLLYTEDTPHNNVASGSHNDSGPYLLNNCNLIRGQVLRQKSNKLTGIRCSPRIFSLHLYHQWTGKSHYR